MSSFILNNETGSSMVDKTALVTGASRGIGRAICQNLAESGATVIACARSQHDLNALLNDLKKNSSTHLSFSQDLMENNGPNQLVEYLISKNVHPDIIVHSLGGSLQERDPFCNVDSFKKVWNYNLGVSIELNRMLIPEMQKRNWGRVIHISTLSTRTYTGNLAYVSAKSALNGYIKNMSRHLASTGVVMCGVSPGLVNVEGRYYSKMLTEDPEQLEKYFDEHLPLRRMIEPEEVGQLVAKLCTNLSNAMSGSIVEIDGGGH